MKDTIIKHNYITKNANNDNTFVLLKTKNNIMKKNFLIAAIFLLTLTNCQKKDTVGTDVPTEETTQDSISTEAVEMASIATDSTAANAASDETASDAAGATDKMSVKSKTITTDPSDGKYALSETKWKLVELDGKMIDNTSKEVYYINLDSKSGKFAAYVGCNNINGVYTNKASDMLAFTKIMTTKKSCSNLDLETKFIKSLEKVDNYTIEDNSLHLKRGKRAHMAKFISVK